jgi:pimeloyl-ACP methyl ester carboxylesterase
VYRIILFDQRGAGKSTPGSELEDNTTWALVEDMEKVRDVMHEFFKNNNNMLLILLNRPPLVTQIRKHLFIEKWHVFGGSWGACLQLAYAQTHPEAVLSMTLRGIFTLRRSELEFFYQGIACHLRKSFRRLKSATVQSKSRTWHELPFRRLWVLRNAFALPFIHLMDLYAPMPYFTQRRLG